jgi:LytS/YehU family sensor histidine kinase
VFYVNYLFLIPRYFLKHKYWHYFVLNIIMVLTLVVGREVLMHYYHSLDLLPVRPRRSGGMGGAPYFSSNSSRSFILFKSYKWVQSMFHFLIAAVISVALRLSLSWHNSEMARKQAEVERHAAELMSLKNQISPHFLLNTLNNIYALTTFDTEKAGQAIHELSKLLRYLLYENQAELVDLEKEADFLHNYIELMRLRISKNVDLKVNLDVPKDRKVSIAPLIFISLVENAFKHGVCPTQPSFVHIDLHVDAQNQIVFTCANSNYPKTEDDKSGGGIGLQQVSQRLALSYPNRHTWHKGAENGTYTSCITLKGE